MIHTTNSIHHCRCYTQHQPATFLSTSLVFQGMTSLVFIRSYVATRLVSNIPGGASRSNRCSFSFLLAYPIDAFLTLVQSATDVRLKVLPFTRNKSSASFTHHTQFHPNWFPRIGTSLNTAMARSKFMTLPMEMRTSTIAVGFMPMARSSSTHRICVHPLILSITSLAWNRFPLECECSFFGPTRSAQWYLSSRHRISSGFEQVSMAGEKRRLTCPRLRALDYPRLSRIELCRACPCWMASCRKVWHVAYLWVVSLENK